MPSSIQPTITPNWCSLPDSSEEEADSITPGASQSGESVQQSSPLAPSAAAPAVSVLTPRFTAPSGTHPPVESSLAVAFSNCKAATAAYLANTAAVLVAAPSTFGWAFVAGAVRIVAVGADLLSCLKQNEAEQIQAGNRANQAADCRREGAVPIIDSAGNVVCER